MSKITKCEIGGEERPLMRYMGMMVCGPCMQKEINLQRELNSGAEDRVKEIEKIHEVDILAKQVEIDASIKIITDVYNAETVAIVDLKEAIDKDDSIENKKFELASRLVVRHKMFQDVIFGLVKKQTEIASKQRNIQQYLNDLGNSLRTTEREKLRIADLSYKPKPVKIKKPKAPKRKKYDKAELNAAANDTGLDAATIQAVCIQQNLEPKAAADMLVNMMKKAG